MNQPMTASDVLENPMVEFQWAKVTVGYNVRLKLDMNDYDSWSAIRALYYGQLRDGSSRGYERIEIVPWPEDEVDV